MINNSIAIFYIIGASGYFTYFSKYSETQYGTSAAQSNIVAGKRKRE